MQAWQIWALVHVVAMTMAILGLNLLIHILCAYVLIKKQKINFFHHLEMMPSSQKYWKLQQAINLVANFTTFFNIIVISSDNKC